MRLLTAGPSPSEALHLLWASLPVLDEIDPYVPSGPIEWHVIDKAKLMDNFSGAVMPLIIGDATRFFGRLHLRKQVGMVTLFHPQNIMTAVIVQGLDVRGIRTQGIFSDNEGEMRVSLTQLADEAFGGIAFTIVFLGAILVDNWLGMSGITSRKSGWIIAAPNIW